MRGFIDVRWLLVTLFTSLGFVVSTVHKTPDTPGFIKASGKEFTLDGE